MLLRDRWAKQNKKKNKLKNKEKMDSRKAVAPKKGILGPNENGLQDTLYLPHFEPH